MYKGDPCEACGLSCREEDTIREFKNDIPAWIADPCLGVLPGVSYACCGHGDPDDAYVAFENGIVFRGFNVIEGLEITIGKRTVDERGGYVKEPGYVEAV